MPFNLPPNLSWRDLDGPSMRSAGFESDDREDEREYDRDFQPGIFIRCSGGERSPVTSGQTVAGSVDVKPKGTTANQFNP